MHEIHIFASILCAIVSHPADVMVSKLNAERQAGESFGGAMSRIYGKIGFGGLWNGLPVRIVSLPRARVDQASLTPPPGHDWYTHRSAMDDLRFVQDLHGSANNWWWRRREEAGRASYEPFTKLTGSFGSWVTIYDIDDSTEHAHVRAIVLSSTNSRRIPFIQCLPIFNRSMRIIKSSNYYQNKLAHTNRFFPRECDKDLGHDIMPN